MYLLDTDTLIFSMKGHARVNENLLERRDAPKAFSSLTYGELVYGARKSERPAVNLAKVYRLAELFPMIPVSRAIMDGFGELKVRLESQGDPIDDFDLIIGATALSMNYSVVTNNERHFRRIPGLRVENWTK